MIPAAPRPQSLLGYHRILSPSSGLRVSPLCLGAMNFGNNWSQYLGECSKDTAFAILDTFRAKGGNFIDTANHYQFGESEIWLGEWLTERGCRDEMVVATKFTTSHEESFLGPPERILSNYQGNHFKSLKLSLEASLRKLQTTYVDLLYVHWWDFTTSIEEMMRGLHQMIMNGKVLYLGISDTPAWLVVKCNACRFHNVPDENVQCADQTTHYRRSIPRSYAFLCLPRKMVRSGPRLRARHTSNVRS